MVGRPSQRYVAATASVLLDKATALVCLFVVAWIALAADFSAVPHDLAGVLAWTTAICGVAILVAATATVASRRLQHHLPERVRIVARQVATTMRGWTRTPRLPLWVFALGIAYQLIAVGVLTLLAKSLGFHLSFSVAAVSAAVIVTAMLMPISIGGFGVREGGFVLLLGKAGIGATAATLLSLLSVLVLILASIATLIPLTLRASQLRQPSSADA
jgi:uncharacterized membrane protein YbhN (UPF0104 family)